VKLDLAARMKELGFRKRALTYWRETSTREATPTKAIQLCEVRPGGSSSSFEGVVTVALSVFFPEFVPLLTPWRTKLPPQVKEADGQVRASLGLVGPWKNAEHAWSIDAQAQDEPLARDLADAVAAHGVPFLENALDMEQLGTGAIPGVDPFLAVLALKRLGRRDDARKRIDAILEARPKEYMAVASFAGRMKLPVPPRPVAR
jgi:hypothetical protein